MPTPRFAEIIYETGDHSIVSIDNGDVGTMLGGVREHHRRAMEGGPAGPAGGAATRIKRVLLYEDHPSNYNITQTLNAETVKEAVDEIVDRVAVGSEVSLTELAAEIRDISNPIINSGAHESNYKMEELDEVPADQWGGDK